MNCITAPKPKLAEKVSQRCIMMVGIQPERPKTQNRLRNADSQIESVMRRYFWVSRTATGLSNSCRRATEISADA
jgi:hypothetical protein